MSVNQELKESYLQPQVLLSKEMKQDVQYWTPYLTYTNKYCKSEYISQKPFEKKKKTHQMFDK